MSDDQQALPPDRRPFAAFIRDARNGALDAELADALQELGASVKETGRKGTLTLKLNVSLNKDGHTLEVVDDVVCKPARADRRGTNFFLDAGNNFVREDPAQLRFGTVREVEKPDATPREAPAPARRDINQGTVS